MLVYGDLAAPEPTATALARLREMLRALPEQPPGIGRHAGLVAALLEAGAVAQGIADDRFTRNGQDDLPDTALTAATALLTTLAEAVGRSWHDGFGHTAPEALPLLAQLSGTALPPQLSRRLAEGFSFYAVYPENFLVAAEAVGPAPDTRVIGLRSIGTVLSAMVSAGLGAPPAVTLRPVGHPFTRQLSLSPALEAALLRGDRFAVVDEGPGLSGSSFGAVLDWLEDRDVAPSRITVFPSHGGAPGPQASARHRARWPRLDRRTVGFEALLRDTPNPARRVEGWAATLLGPARAPTRDISGGGWRPLRFAAANDFPPVHPFAERRKLLYEAADGVWLLKFVGLGHHGEAQAERARRLGEAGFSPPVAGFRHGFLVERWIADARPLSPGEDREALVEFLIRYLAFRVRHLPAGDAPGATAEALWQMARYNAAEALGEEAACPLDRWRGCLPALDAAIRRTRTDNRLHRWEWLRLADGRLLKTDAVDHAAAHDLVGCQDIAWDIAGAEVELDLDPEQAAALRRGVERDAGIAVDGALLRLMRPCYLAFQLGAWTMAASATDGASPDRGRAEGLVARYRDALARRLAEGAGW